MNAVLEIAVIGATVGLAVLFVAFRVFKALSGGRPSCCSDAGENSPLAGQLAGTASCADGTDARPDFRGPDGSLKPRPSYCAGCTGCGSRP